MKNIQSYFKALFVGITVVSLAVSCKKLVEKPKSFITPEDFYTTPSQVEAAFAASMNRLWDYWGGYGYGMGNFVHDDQYEGGDLVIARNHGSDLWNRHFAAIQNLNAAIRAMKKGSLGSGTSQAALDNLMGQAKFLRAYNYFMLVRMFGDLPLYTEDIAEPITAQIGRTPVADVYKLIVSDFLEATTKLPATLPASQKGRPSSDAAKGLLAKVYLTMATAPLNDVSNYQKAADMANQVIQGGRYSLVTDINKVFSSIWA